jgi:Universal stress protein family
LVSINSPLAFTSDAIFKSRLEKFLGRYNLLNFTARIYSHEDFASGITQYAKSVDADLIMMATHGRTGVSGLLNSSIAEDVIHQSHVPVWTCSTKNVPVLTS